MDANEVIAKRLDFQFKTNKIILNELKCCCSNLYKEIVDIKTQLLERLDSYHDHKKVIRILWRYHAALCAYDHLEGLMSKLKSLDNAEVFSFFQDMQMRYLNETLIQCNSGFDTIQAAVASKCYDILRRIQNKIDKEVENDN